MALGKNIKKSNPESKTVKDEKKDSQKSETKALVSEEVTNDQVPEVKDVKTPDTQSPEKTSEDIADQRTNISNESSQLMIVFPVDNEEYAMSIDAVNEVVKIPPIAAIPQTPSYILGVANVRGEVIPIFDLGRRIGTSIDETSNSAKYILVIREDELKIGLAVERVPDTISVADSEIDNSSNVVVQSTQDNSYLKGIIKKENRMIILVDLLEIINDGKAVS